MRGCGGREEGLWNGWWRIAGHASDEAWEKGMAALAVPFPFEEAVVCNGPWMAWQCRQMCVMKRR
jgi:hypothetical protein